MCRRQGGEVLAKPSPTENGTKNYSGIAVYAGVETPNCILWCVVRVALIPLGSGAMRCHGGKAGGGRDGGRGGGEG